MVLTVLFFWWAGDTPNFALKHRLKYTVEANPNRSDISFTSRSGCSCNRVAARLIRF